MNYQTTQHICKAAISNALELRSMTANRNNSNDNFELESYAYGAGGIVNFISCDSCNCSCG